MKRENIIVGLDIGTTKICALVGEVKDGRIDIFAMGSSQSAGLRKGVVVDMEAAADSIKKAVKKAESTAGMDLKSAYVGIAGGHIKSFESYGAVGIKGKKVSLPDVERAIDFASVIYVPLDREVLHIMPAGFILDGLNNIKDPIGMSGARLEVKVHIVTGAISPVQNLLKCCEIAGLYVDDIVLEPIASAFAALHEDEKERGVVLIDIGGGTTDIAVYSSGCLRHAAVLALGGNHFTNDIAVGMEIPVHEAERVKKKYGCALNSSVDWTEDMEVRGHDGRVLMIPRRHIAEILQPRCEELAEMIGHEIRNISVKLGLSGAVLTGGASLLEGLDKVIGTELALPIRIGVPEKMRTGHIISMNDSVSNPVYATGTGLVIYGADAVNEKVLHGDSFNGIFERMKIWVKNLLKVDGGKPSEKRNSDVMTYLYR